MSWLCLCVCVCLWGKYFRNQTSVKMEPREKTLMHELNNSGQDGSATTHGERDYGILIQENNLAVWFFLFRGLNNVYQVVSMTWLQMQLGFWGFPEINLMHWSKLRKNCSCWKFTQVHVNADIYFWMRMASSKDGWLFLAKVGKLERKHRSSHRVPMIHISDQNVQVKDSFNVNPLWEKRTPLEIPLSSVHRVTTLLL